MAKDIVVPDSLTHLVAEVEEPVSSRDVDTFGELQEIRDRSQLMRTIVTAGKHQQKQDRDLRERYAKWLIIALGVQAIAINVIYVLMGFGLIKVEPWTATTFTAGVFAEIVSLVLVVVKYLFKATSDNIFDLLPTEKRRRKSRGD